MEVANQRENSASFYSGASSCIVNVPKFPLWIVVNDAKLRSASPNCNSLCCSLRRPYAVVDIGGIGMSEFFRVFDLVGKCREGEVVNISDGMGFYLPPELVKPNSNDR